MRLTAGCPLLVILTDAAVCGVVAASACAQLSTTLARAARRQAFREIEQAMAVVGGKLAIRAPRLSSQALGAGRLLIEAGQGGRSSNATMAR